LNLLSPFDEDKTVSFLRFCKHLYLTRFSKPEGERVIFRAMKRKPVQRIVELGMGDMRRTHRMLQFASELAKEDEKIHFTGIDLFESRPAVDGKPVGIPLKEAHRLLKLTGHSIKLIPGDPYSALARAANSLQNSDLIVISAGHDQESLERAWFYVPRMMHENTLIFLEQPETDEVEAEFVLLQAADVKQKVQQQDARGRRAA
jgi:hypothetical protein